MTLALLDIHDPRLKTRLLQQPVAQWGEGLVVLNSLMIFTLWVGVGRVEAHFLTFVGVVSYSLYLFHPLVSEWLVRGLRASGVGLPLWALLVAGGGCSVGLAAVLYRWVEHPAVMLGRRWTELGGPRPRLTTHSGGPALRSDR